MEPQAVDTDVNILFSRDPMTYTNEDIDKIIAEFRKRRNSFNAAPAAAAKKPSTSKPSAISSLKIELDL